MDAQIVIDLQTGTPPYEQVQTQISSLIAVGQLPAGTRLPTIRSLAADLGVAAGTVARAYKELEAAGLVTTNRRQGTVVAEGLLPQGALADERNPGATAVHPPPPVTNALGVMAAVEHLIEEGERAGLDGKMLVTLLQGRLNQRGK
ncbi:GntR family transcriptional regulator [Arthrobacter sp. N199823]|uniref:GntR family transcriptional regulator n=1 Tax=Arthrobacter sp. N199823 TaxID=2058895 RepID=UPI000CE4F2C0|nr:GntR family transcriptional regulator [Arthrobacter sp. N199823]